MKKDEHYLMHILDACWRIEEYIEGYDHEAFLKDRKTQDAVARQLEVIGEAARRLATGFREANTEIPWHAIIGMRNRIAHDYLNVDLDVLWEVTQFDLPVLKSFVEKWK